ncbi:MAG TPA: hypothetical protein VL595_11720 [Pseudonocardia sp.]|jgi:hypothetical protein|nr:hypothetical protein [Pseudonocardia sp.]
MSHTSDQPEPHDQRHWREFTDRDAHQDRLTHELAGSHRSLTGTEDW